MILVNRIAYGPARALDSDTTGRERTLAVLVFLAAFTIALVPLFASGLPPLADYPNHLTRMFLIADAGRSDDLAQYYRVRWAMLPNLAMDAIVPLLARVMPLAIAGKTFLAAVLLLNAGGVIALHRALWGRWRLWPCLGFLLLYNQIFLWGFVNFLFGQGLAFCAAAAWVAAGPARPVSRGVIGAVLGWLVYLSHIEAFCLLTLIILGLEAAPALALSRRGQWAALAARAIPICATLLPPLAAFALIWAPGASGPILFSSMVAKLDMLMTLFKNYNPAIDLATTVLFFGLLLSLAVTRRLKAAPALGWWLGLFVPIYILLPAGIFSGYAADRRLPVVIFMLVIAGTEPRRLSRRTAAVLTVCFAALFVFRMALIERVWLKAAQVYAADEEILSLLPPRARLAVASPWEILRDTDIPEVHVPTLAVSLRHAYVPTVFALPAQQPLENTERAGEMAGLAAPDQIFAAFVTNDHTVRAAVAAALPHFDYAIFLHIEPFQPVPGKCLTFVRGTATFQLFKINPCAGLLDQDG